MNNFTHVRRNGGARQNVMSKAFLMINAEPHGIPELKNTLGKPLTCRGLAAPFGTLQ